MSIGIPLHAGQESPEAGRLNAEVILVPRGDTAFLLDFSRGRFYALDPTATRMLTEALRQTPDGVVACLVREYEVAPERARKDVEDFLARLREEGVLVSTACAPCPSGEVVRRWLLTVGCGLLSALLRLGGALLAHAAGGGKEGRAPGRSGSVQDSGLLLALAWLSVRLLGWRGSVALWSAPVSHPPGPDRRAVAAVRRAVRAAASSSLLPTACKENALVAHYLLRRVYGLPSVLIVGIELYPFRAHAWVECDGQVVTDDPDHCAAFLPVAWYP